MTKIVNEILQHGLQSSNDFTNEAELIITTITKIYN